MITCISVFHQVSRKSGKQPPSSHTLPDVPYSPRCSNQNNARPHFFVQTIRVVGQRTETFHSHRQTQRPYQQNPHHLNSAIPRVFRLTVHLLPLVYGHLLNHRRQIYRYCTALYRPNAWNTPVRLSIFSMIRMPSCLNENTSTTTGDHRISYAIDLRLVLHCQRFALFHSMWRKDIEV